MRGDTNNIIVGTRRSRLALAQTDEVLSELGRAHPGVDFVVREIVTKGDRDRSAPLARIRGRGVFTKALEEALACGEIDLAVHSLKDLPTTLPKGLALLAVPRRLDPRDALIARTATSLSGLPHRARVGTSSARRAAQLLARRPDLRICEVRGNVETRIQKLTEGDSDAIVLAAAGLVRLGLIHKATQILPLDVMLPAVGQGALAIEGRADDARVRAIVAVVEHADTRSCVDAERALLAALGGGCRTPLGALATPQQPDGILVRAVLYSRDGREAISKQIRGPMRDAVSLGRSLAREILAEKERNARTQCFPPSSGV